MRPHDRDEATLRNSEASHLLCKVGPVCARCGTDCLPRRSTTVVHGAKMGSAALSKLIIRGLDPRSARHASVNTCSARLFAPL